MRYLIGIDGGGTKTHALLADERGRVLGERTSGPSNLTAYSPGEVRESLRGLIPPLLEGIPAGSAAAVCLGSAGVSRAGAARELAEMIESLCPGAAVRVVGDMEIALCANSPGLGEGILLISGTGSVCFGRDPKGRTARAGGWGHILSDEGSGYWIGLRAIRRAVLAADGRAPQSPLTARVRRELGLSPAGGAEEIVSAVSSPACTKASVARLCRAVEDCAAQGDAAAGGILRDAAAELHALALAVAERLDFSAAGVAAPAARVICGGSVLTKCAPLRAQLERRFTGGPFCAILEEAKEPAARGALKAAAALLESTPNGTS